MSDEEKRPQEEEMKAGGQGDGVQPEESADPAGPVEDSDTLDSAKPSQEDPRETTREAETIDDGSEEESLAAAVATASVGVHAHAGGHGDAHHGDEHFAHTSPMSLLVGVLGALVILTVLTVAVTAVDLGSQGNFVVAMIIATVKAALVMGYFMHLVWDSKFNVILFLSSFLFVLLFLSMAVLDRGEYAPDVRSFENDQATLAN